MSQKRAASAERVGWLVRLTISRDFALLWLGQAFSSFGEYVLGSTITVWLVLDLAPHSAYLPSLIAAVVLASALPRLFVAPLAGVLVDRWSARTTMIAADALRVVVFIPAVFVVAFGRSAIVNIALAIALLFSISGIAQFFNAARAALMQVVIPPDRRAVASSSSVFAGMGVAVIATMLGPALYAAVGPVPALLIALSTYALSGILVSCTSRRHSVPKAEATEGGYWGQLRAGFLAAWRNKPIRVILIGVALYGVSLGVNNSVLSLFALKTAGLSASQYGLVAGMFSVGGLAGVLVVPSIFTRVAVQRAFVTAIIAMGAIYGAYSVSRGFFVLASLMLLAGLAFSVYITAQGPILQDATPLGYMGRITSVTTPVLALSSVVATAITSLAISGVGHAIGARGAPPPVAYAIAIGVAAVLMVAGGVILWAADVRQARRRSEAPTGA